MVCSLSSKPIVASKSILSHHRYLRQQSIASHISVQKRYCNLDITSKATKRSTNPLSLQIVTQRYSFLTFLLCLPGQTRTYNNIISRNLSLTSKMAANYSIDERGALNSVDYRVYYRKYLPSCLQSINVCFY